MRKLFRKKSKQVLRQHDWVVTYEVNGTPVKYFRWDKDEVWKWTPSLSRASRFPSENNARINVEGTEMAWRFRYEVRPIPQ